MYLVRTNNNTVSSDSLYRGYNNTVIDNWTNATRLYKFIRQLINHFVGVNQYNSRNINLQLISLSLIFLYAEIDPDEYPQE